MSDTAARAGASIYSKPVLMFYDAFVVHFSSTCAWRCTSSRMLAQYDENMGPRHLDVGPGTGWYLERARRPTPAEITLMDLNENSLQAASSRLEGVRHHTIHGNVLEPLPTELGPFDSIAANYLMHCVPGDWSDKHLAFAHLAERLTPDGVLFGSTILGQGVDHNPLGRALMRLYNRKGVFNNTRDDAAGLERALQQHFEQVDVEVVGTTGLFRARQPRRHLGSTSSPRPR